MPSKLAMAMDFLELISEPTTIDIIEISKKINCSERQVWRALRRLREDRQKASEKYDLLKDLQSDMTFLLSLLHEMGQEKRTLKIDEIQRLTSIEDRLEAIGKKIVELEGI